MATFDCIPLAIPTALLLLPYGGGSLSSMMQYSNRSDFVGGISKEVYQCLHIRLRHTVRLPVLSSLKVSAQGTPEALCFADEVTLAVHRLIQQHRAGPAASASLSWWWEKGPNWSLGMPSRVRLGQACSDSSRQLSSVLSWCLQDWWGEEVCVSVCVSKISVNSKKAQVQGDSLTEKEIFWSGWMDIQCNNRSTLLVLSDDANNLIHALTGGLMHIGDSGPVSARDQLQLLPLPKNAEDRGLYRKTVTVPTSELLARAEGFVGSRASKTCAVRNIMMDRMMVDVAPVSEVGSVASFL